MASALLDLDTTKRLPPTCAPISLKVVLGADDILCNKTMSCICEQKVVEFRAFLLSAVEEGALHHGRFMAASVASLLLQAHHRVYDQTHLRSGSKAQFKSTCCWIRSLDAHCGTADLLDLSYFMGELREWGCDCAGREVHLTLLTTPSLAAIRGMT